MNPEAKAHLLTFDQLRQYDDDTREWEKLKATVPKVR